MAYHESTDARARRALGRLAGLLGVTWRSRVFRALDRAIVTSQQLRSIRRTQWLYEFGRSRPPTLPIDRRPPSAVGSADVELCRRLVAAYDGACETSGATGSSEGMWSYFLATHQRDLAATVERGDAEELAELMASMFRQDFVRGMSWTQVLSCVNSRLSMRVWNLRSLDALVSLAEAIGVVAMENPEQGGTGLAFDQGLEQLADRMEQALEFKLDFPDVGAPSGLALAGRLLTHDTPDQVYAALRLDQAITLHLDRGREVTTRPHVVEIGGGYGGMCYWFLQRRDSVARYTIVDLPIANVIQGYFLGRTLGPESVSFFGEPLRRVAVVPDFALAQVEAPFEVLANKDSMPEMPYAAMVSYIEWAAANCQGIFYSYNQEASADFRGEAQGVVHRAVAQTGRFERIRRDESWVRRGYAEEVYVPARDRADTEW